MVGQPSYLGVATGDWVAALKSSDALERRLAAHALAEIGPAAREAVPALIVALRDPESFVRVWAAAALARVQPENADAIPALVAATRDGLSFVPVWQRGTWGALGRDTLELSPWYRSCASCSTTKSVRAETLVALENLAGKGAPPAELKSLAPTADRAMSARVT